MTSTTIHIEGMDLAGKTTTRDRLAKRLGGWTVRSNKLCEQNAVFDIADRLRRGDGLGSQALGHLFVAAIAADLEWYESPAAPLIQDSTILLRSLAYHRVHQSPLVVQALESFLSVHPRFTKTFVLTASLDARRVRLQMRRQRSPGEVAPDDLMIDRSPGKFMAMERELVAIATEHFDAEVIDTSNLSPDEVVDRIAASPILGRSLDMASTKSF